MQIENYNGRKYEIIEQTGDYTLLKELNDKAVEPFIVAFLLELDEDNKGEWNQGRYFQTLEEAQNEFEMKVNR